MSSHDSSRWILHGIERTVFSLPPWIHVGMQWVEKPNSGETEDHVAVTLPAAALVVLTDQGGDHVLLSWRHRHVPDVEGWELPAGLIEDGETPEEAATREVREETGYEVVNLEHVTTFEPAVGSVKNPHHVFRGTASEHAAEPTEQDEGIAEWVPWDRIPALLAAGTVPNAGALVGLQQGLLARQTAPSPDYVIRADSDSLNVDIGVSMRPLSPTRAAAPAIREDWKVRKEDQ